MTADQLFSYAIVIALSFLVGMLHGKNEIRQENYRKHCKRNAAREKETGYLGCGELKNKNSGN